MVRAAHPTRIGDLTRVYGWYIFIQLPNVSYDGEIRAHQQLSLDLHTQELKLVVDPEYSTDPDK